MITEELKVLITANTSAFNAGISSVESRVKSAKKAMSGDFTGLSGVGKSAAGAGAGLSGLTKAAGVAGAAFAAINIAVPFAKECISLSSDLQEVQNVVDVTFGSMSDDINNFAKNAKKQFGLSELAAKQYASTMGAMLKSSGITGSPMKEMSKNITALAADMASFYNLDSETAFEKIRSGISGETEPLKQLGINMSVANLEAYAMTQGITKSYSAMSQAEQTLLRYNYLLSVTGDAQGDFARTSDSWANQTRILTENWKEFKALLGDALIPVLTKVVKVLNVVLETLIKIGRAIKTVVNSIKSVFGIGSSMDSSNQSTQDMAQNAQGAAQGTEDIAQGAEDTANGLEDAKKSAQDLQNVIGGFDELHIIAAEDTNSIDNFGGIDDNAMSGTINPNRGDNPFKDAVDDSTDSVEALADALKDVTPELEKIKDAAEEAEKSLEEIEVPELKPVEVPVDLPEPVKIPIEEPEPVIIPVPQPEPVKIPIEEPEPDELPWAAMEPIKVDADTSSAEQTIQDFITSFPFFQGSGIDLLFRARTEGIDEVEQKAIGIDNAIQKLRTPVSIAISFAGAAGIIMSLGGIVSGITAIGSAATGLAGCFAPINDLSQITENANSHLLSLGQVSSQSSQNIRESFSNAIQSVSQSTSDMANTASQNLSQIDTGNAEKNITDTFSGMSQQASRITQMMSKDATSNLSGINAGGADENVSGTFSKMRETVMQIVSGISGDANESLSSISGSDAVSNIQGPFSGLAQWMSSLFNNIKQMWNDLKSSFSNFSFNMSASVSSSGSSGGGGGDSRASLSSIGDIEELTPVTSMDVPTLASGGVLRTGQLFIANERAPELVGNIGGRTGVMNNDQIVEAVSAGVASAVAQTLGGVGQQELTTTISGDDLQLVLNRANQKRSTGISNNFAFGGR